MRNTGLELKTQRSIAVRLRGLATVAFFGLLATGCANEPNRLGPPVDVAFDAENVANSIFSLRFAPDNAVVVQVHTIALALGLTVQANAVPAPGAVATPAPSGVASRLTIPVRRDRVEARPRRGAQDRVEIMRYVRASPLEGLVASRARNLAAGQAAPIFPINFLGKDFVFDAGLDAYVEFGNGGPENGVRFELYVVDLQSGLPALPLSPVGFVDLTDISDATSTRLRVRAFDDTGSNTIELANYIVDGAFASSSVGVTVSLLGEGFVRDQNGRFDFEYDELLESDDLAGITSVSSIHRTVSAEGTDVRLAVTGEIANDGSQSDLSFEMDIDGAAGLTLVDLRVINGQQDGEIQHRGRLEAVVTGTVQNPSFTAAGAFDFTLAEVAALDEILFGVDDILLFVSEIYVPLADLFGVG